MKSLTAEELQARVIFSRELRVLEALEVADEGVVTDFELAVASDAFRLGVSGPMGPVLSLVVSPGNAQALVLLVDDMARQAGWGMPHVPWLCAAREALAMADHVTIRSQRSLGPRRWGNGDE
jgi:hypothetical protein